MADDSRILPHIARVRRARTFLLAGVDDALDLISTNSAAQFRSELGHMFDQFDIIEADLVSMLTPEERQALPPESIV